MKSRVHEVMVSYLGYRIPLSIPINELRETVDDPAIIETIENIGPVGTPTLELVAPHEGELGEPDAAYGEAEAKYPNLVIEVAYSETLDHLHSKARRWVCGSDGAIRWVLGIKVDPAPAPLRVEAWLWQAISSKAGSWSIRKVQSQVIIPTDPDQPFLTLLKLRHFLALDSNVPPHIQRRPLAIPLSSLAKKIDGAIKRQAMDVEEKVQKRVLKEDGKKASSLVASTSTTLVQKERKSSRYDFRPNPRKA
ncbi:MAG: hypothetical protein Q9207_003788 [Kuettlingeria erythrocarpa]